MIDEIMQGLNTYGAKEILEQQLGNHIAKRDRAWTNINLYYKKDTANFLASCDSLIALNQNENRLSAKYNLAFMHLDQADSLNAFNVLDNIPAEFDLSAQELSTHTQYLDLFDILWQIKSDTTGLDSIQIQNLYNLASAYRVLPGAYASNLMIKEGLLNYNELVYLADPLKSAPAPEIKPEMERKSQHISLFPNPAGNYFIASYDLREEESPGLITISDVNGKELRAFQLKDKQNQIVISALEVTNGIYLIKLQAGNKILDTEKVSINR